MDVGEVKLIDYMGSDLSVVNAARVSFKKKKNSLDARDVKLIHYLARHNHWTPFGHTALTFYIKAPLFVARQLAKHQVGLVWNEVSRRYVDDPPEFYVPPGWRKRAENKKQGSADEVVDLNNLYSDGLSVYALFLGCLDNCREVYDLLLKAEVCPEQARMILPQNMYTEWYWTGSLAAFARVCKLRLDEHAQWETRQIAQKINDAIPPAFSVSWAALMEHQHG